MTSATGDMSDIQIDVEALHKKYEEERQKRLRPDALDQYRELKGKFAHFADDPYADHNFRRDPVIANVDVLIIGGGFGGLLAGAHLRRAGIKDIHIVEKGGDFGGTWYWNRYPGVACDVESLIYLPLLEEMGYVPSDKYAKGFEIFAYCRKLAEHYDLYPGALLQTEVTQLRWDEEGNRWIVSTNWNDRIAARFVISCTGLLSKPKLPGIPGIETFGGHSFHTSRWDYAYTGGDQRGGLVDLRDKNVGIIGTGSTAIQCVPHLGAWSKHLYVFQRTPSTVDERNDHPLDDDWVKSLKPGWQRERQDNFTLVTSGVCQDEDMVNDGWTDIIRHATPPTGGNEPTDLQAVQLAEMKKMEKARKRIDRIVKDKATAEALKPYYHYFCKRPCFHDEYLETFNRPNVTLVDTGGRGVERVTPKGVIVAGREYPLDCLIFATGFDFMTEYTRESGIGVIGRSGHSLGDHWARGAHTLWGMHTRGFPNFFLMSLVQAGIAINYVHVADVQTRHIAHVIQQCMARRATAVEPTQKAEDDWVDTIMAMSGPRRAFLDACTPGYYNHEGRRDKSFELNEPYGGGAMAYIKIIEDWRAEGSMHGLEFSGTDQEIR